VQRILDESLQGLLLLKAYIQDIADRLLEERRGNSTSKC
jgi:hypothetical protein